MPVNELKAYLDYNHVKYVSIKHSSAYTAQEIASSAHVSGTQLAKTVILKVDGRLVMAVLPASFIVNFKQLSVALGTDMVALAHENEFKDVFPGCEVGAMPPFGNLYKMEVFVAETLRVNEEIAFNAGNHKELFRINYKDFEGLVKPKILRFTTKMPAHPKQHFEKWEDIY